LSLPLPASNQRILNITFVPLYHSNQKKIYQVKADNTCKLTEVKQRLMAQIEPPLVDTDSIVLADVYQHTIFAILPNERQLSSIQPTDVIYAYEVHKGGGTASKVSTASPKLLYIQFAHRLASNQHVLGTPFILSVEIKQDPFIYLTDLFDQIVSYLFHQRTSHRLFDKFCVIDENNTRYKRQVSGVVTIKPKSKWVIEWTDEAAFGSLPVESIDSEHVIEPKTCQLNKTVTIYDCLRLFLSSEKLSKNDEWQCTRCQVKHQATKKFDLWKMPTILVIHLKRFQYDRWCRHKIDTLVDFPVEGLDLTASVINKKEGAVLYDLFAISVHSGGLGAGHYTAYGLNHANHKWYYFNDSFVSPCDLDHLPKAGAYVLFYQRRDQPK